MIAPEPIDPRDLPAIAENRITKCAGCGEFLLNRGPTFWLVAPVRACFDAQGLRERVGLTMMMGGSAALGSMFAASPAAREIDRLPEICVCEGCAMTVPLAVLALREEGDASEAEGEEA